MINKHKLFFWHSIFIIIISLGCSIAVQANNSIPTPTVVGHKPIAKNVIIENINPNLGDELKLYYEYEDYDSDVTGVPIVTWYYNGKEVSGQKSMSYTPVFDPITGEGVECKDVTVHAEITPKSITGDPQYGDKVTTQSVNVSINLGVIPGFIKPSAIIYNSWSSANSYCISQGARLPTVAELKFVFNTYAQTTGFSMSSKYGWPLQSARCGGNSNSYWASDVAPNGTHYDVSMYDGSEYYFITDNSPYHVACKID